MAARVEEEETPMAEGTTLEAPIAAVTVFRNGARVQRSGTVSLEPGLRPIVVRNLQATVDPDSVRIAARGRGLALLMSVVHRRYHAPIPFVRKPGGCVPKWNDAGMPSGRLTTRTPPNRRAWASWATCPRPPLQRLRGR